MFTNQPIQDDITTQIAINHGVIRARWMLIVGLGFLGLFLKFAGQGQFTIIPTFFEIFLLLAVGSTYNLIYSLYLSKRKLHTAKGLNYLAFFQVTVDILVFSTVIILAGGVDSSAFLYYVYPIIAASQLFRTRGILYAIALSTTLYTAIIALEFFGIFQHSSSFLPEFSPNHFSNPQFTFTIVINVIFSLSLAGVFASVTSRIKQEHANTIKIERDRVSAILESLDDGIVLIDTNNRLIMVNKSSEHMLNMSRAHMLNLTLNKKNITALKDHDNMLQLFFPSTEYNSPTLKTKYNVIFKKPVHMVIEVITIPVSDDNNNIIGFLKNMHDVTRESEIDRMKSEFISIAAHQLRTPLSAMKWSLKMVMDGDVGHVPTEMNTLIGKTYNTNERMIRLVNDLLNVSRIEEGRFKYVYEKLDIVKFLDSAVQEIRQAAKNSNTKITWHPPKNLPFVLADEDRLRLAIMNLLDNALKYTIHNGHITISAEESINNQIKISITDNGMGIPADEQYRLYSKFYRGSNVLKQQTEGSGLGLFIVKNIIDKHRGGIECVSTVGKGTTFYVYLPTEPPEVYKKTFEGNIKPFEKFLTDF